MMPKQDRVGDPPRAVMTPFVAKVLGLVKESCDPKVEDWADRLAEALHRSFDIVAEPGQAISAEAFNALHFRLLTVEQKLSPNPERTVRLPFSPHLNYQPEGNR